MHRGIVRELSRLIGSENVLSDRAELLCYSYDASGLESLPDVVVLPTSTEDVTKVMAFSYEKAIPIFPRGAGTGVTGASLPSGGGIVLSMTRMNRILSINRPDLMAEVEPGVVTGEFQDKVASMGLFYPPDPASLRFCTIGGNIATGAGGPRAVKYGVTRDYVMGLEIVLPGGDLTRVGVRTAKGVVGYDLTRLMVGSEGTLGVITKAILRLIPAPEAVGTLIAFFEGAGDAADAVTGLFGRGILPRCAELLDSLSLDCIRDNPGLAAPDRAKAMLLVEVDGPESQVAEQLAIVTRVFTDSGAIEVRAARNNDEVEAFWDIRRSLSPAIKRLGFPHKINEDICVPRHALPEMIGRIADISMETGLTILTFGHAGDGNLHVNILLDKGEGFQNERAEVAVKEIFEATIAFGGTISGEHGIGLTKKAYVGIELDKRSLEIMRAIKTVFDPEGLLNPAKMFPEA
ncbi:MAG: FAD-binding oxidoreductase [Dissulfurimicrobium sp.]|uniref:FAD-binding oxidoreductase n=1 Tax=Dissulfurimicrobium TaxID=1769732 RepID=UPI001EDB549F|nr:FAD-linked oxidase C-terminal domain-containing protein [Dissulfurimicrobium hydrothermale]UKL13447.1 FAD-binding protein [Dissulfurimicrobium hydrothermale]